MEVAGFSLNKLNACRFVCTTNIRNLLLISGVARIFWKTAENCMQNYLGGGLILQSPLLATCLLFTREKALILCHLQSFLCSLIIRFAYKSREAWMHAPRVINGTSKRSTFNISHENFFHQKCSNLSLVFDYFPSRYSQTTKVSISGIPQHANFSDVEPLLKQYGNVEECDAVASKDPKTQTVHITFETFEQAQRWDTKGLFRLA